MIFWILIVFVSIIAYLIGSFNYSIIMSEVFIGSDIRKKGSGNAGSTNMLRNYGWKAGAITLLSDFMKAFVATLAAWAIFTRYMPEYAHLGTAVAGFFCAVGHCFPLYFDFRGGKGVAVGGIMILMTDVRCFLVALAVFVILVALFRYISLGSVSAGISFPVSYALILGLNSTQNKIVFVFAAALAIMVAVLHRANIARLFKGTESKFKLKK